jgi:8-oxo-dGTP pyrophosphatase MutT (NUDIX family)
MQYDESCSIPVNYHAAGVVILDAEKRILLVKELEGDKKGLWHIPSGTVEKGETLEAAAIREAKEESGLDVTLSTFLGSFLGRLKWGDMVLRHCWLATYDSNQTAKPDFADEIGEAKFFSKDEFDTAYESKQIRMHLTKQAYTTALEIVNQSTR